MRVGLPVLERRPERAGPGRVDSRTLETELRQCVRGEVRFDAGSRALYATDASNYRQVPIGVVIPRDVEDVVEAIAACRRHGAPVLPRGGGTSLAGQCCNVAVVLDFTKHVNRVLEVDPTQRLARVEPGVVLDDLRRPAERNHGLSFGPDPSTHNRCTFGGMIGNNACGVHSVLTEFYGPGPRTSDNLEALDVLTYDGERLRVGATPAAELARIIAQGGRRGEIYARLASLRDRYAELIRARFPKIPRRVSGYGLDALLPENDFHVARALAGSEGTCVTILEATVRLVPFPAARSLLVLGYPDVYRAADAVPDVRAHRPIGLEGMDDVLIEDIRKKRLHAASAGLLPEGRGWLLVEFGGETEAEAKDRARALMAALGDRGDPPGMRLLEDPAEARAVWILRESGLGATAFIPGEDDTWEGWEDSAVAPERLGDYLRELHRLMRRYGYRSALYGHFGQGCVHLRINFELVRTDGIRRYREFVTEAADLVVRCGGSISGEHGDGQSRAELLGRMFGPELVEAFRQFKAIWDPAGKMNPGKVVDPFPLDANLRLGPEYRPRDPATHFRFPADRGSLARAALRCVGVGECRKRDGGTMCPSYMVTLEERHSTRGRAHLLFELLRGDSLGGGWRDPHVKEALDLCLACKACKGECPVNVDIATYKAEFLAHYYRGRLRPPAAYAMGLIHVWARAAAAAPRAANFVTHARGLAAVSKRVAGIAPERVLPRFAAETFRAWWRRRPPTPDHDGNGARHDRPAVILWPDTFNNYFHPETARAATRVLEAAGFRVLLPAKTLCCGRPLYDWGMLAHARRLLKGVLRTLREDIARGTPVVGLEPSCVAVFRDELIGLMPHDLDAQRLSRQTFPLAEFLETHAPAFRAPPLRRRALVHAHCHQRAILGTAHDAALLSKLGLDHTLLDSGCCGMAGSFGFERDKYEVSMRVGERVLLPAVRAAPEDTLLVADGFSCREQIAQATGRRALHLAEVLNLALDSNQAPRT